MTAVQALLKLMESQGWTLAVIGEELDVPVNSLRAWASGKEQPANPKIVTLALERLFMAAPPRSKSVSAEAPPDLRAAVESAKGLFRHYAPEGGVVDEFLKERREAAI